MERIISNERQLGAFIHDLRIQEGMTQADLALKAGVSRKWLIGLEQGARTRAELGKIFDTLHALGVSMRFSSIPEQEAQEKTRSGKAIRHSNKSQISQKTLDAIRSFDSPNQAVSDALKSFTSPNQAALAAIRSIGNPNQRALEVMRRNATPNSGTNGNPQDGTDAEEDAEK